MAIGGQQPDRVRTNRVNDITTIQRARNSIAHPPRVRKLPWSSRIKKFPLWAVFLIAAILSTATAIFFMVRYQAAQKEIDQLSTPQEVTKQEQQALVAAVGKLVELPAGETPTIATVSDATKLQNQAFFAQAKNGDKVLIYSQAKRAILYRPADSKVIEVAPINIGDTSTGQN